MMISVSDLAPALAILGVIMREDLSSGFTTMQDSNQPAQLQREAEPLRVASLSIILSRGRTTKALIRLRGCVGWSALLIFECNYVRFSLDTAHKYDNCHYNNCVVFAMFSHLGYC